MNTPWWYLGGATVGAWFTKQALRPVQRPALRALPSFFAGWLTNELAFHHLAWQAAATAGFVRRGALRAWPGKLALGLTLVQWAGIGVLIRRTFASRAAMQAAVDQVLAELGAASGAPADEVDAEFEGVRWSQLVLPFPMRHPDVVRTKAITFARAGGIDLQLDVYRRRDLPTGRPVLLYVHGGAWVISNRNEQGIPLMHEMAARGWVGVNADYRLSPWATFPDQLVDVKRAVAWIRDHADEIGADASFIAVAGGSAGGHLASLAALTVNRPGLQPRFEHADTSLQACVSFYGVYDFLGRDPHPGHDQFAKFVARYVMKATPEDDPALYALASPIDQIHPDAPPFLVVHGSEDTLAPGVSAATFARRLREVSTSPVGYAELPGTQHAFDVFPSLRTAYVLDGVATFLTHAYAHARSVARVAVREEV